MNKIDQQRTYTLEEIERMTDFKVTITPAEWLICFKANPLSTAEDYTHIYGQSFMAHAVPMIHQLVKMVHHRDIALAKYRQQDEERTNENNRSSK